MFLCSVFFNKILFVYINLFLFNSILISILMKKPVRCFKVKSDTTHVCLDFYLIF